jgi:hypothetical protein
MKDQEKEIYKSEDYLRDEITLGEILRGIVAYTKEVFRWWWLILLVGLILGGLFYYRSTQEEITYQASLTFMINEDKSGGGLVSILGQVGLGGGGGGGEYSLEKIVELSKSQLITQQVLLDSVEVDGKADQLANHILDAYQLADEWQEEGRDNWAQVRYTNDSLEGMNLTERKVLKYLYAKMTGRRNEVGLVTMTMNPLVGMLTIDGQATNEELTQAVTEKTYEHLSQFYIEKTTSGPQRTYDMLRSRTDSIKRALAKVEYSLAYQRDVSSGLFRSQDQISMTRMEREKSILQIMYGEIIKNLATAEFSLTNTTPFFSVVDRPFYPLEKRVPNKLWQALVGFMLGVMVITMILIIRKAVIDAIKSEK